MRASSKRASEETLTERDSRVRFRNDFYLVYHKSILLMDSNIYVIHKKSCSHQRQHKHKQLHILSYSKAATTIIILQKRRDALGHA